MPPDLGAAPDGAGPVDGANTAAVLPPQARLLGEGTYHTLLAAAPDDGYFLAGFELGPGASYAEGHLLVSRYGPSGELLWSRSFGAGQGTMAAEGLAATREGCVAIAGQCVGALDVVGPETLAGRWQQCLLYLDRAGNVLSGRRFGLASIATSQVYRLAIAPDGDTVLAGRLSTDTQFGGVTLAQAQNGGYLVKLAPDGTPRWALAFPQSSALSFGVDPQGDVAVCGSYAGALALGGTAPPLPSPGQRRGFIGKLDGSTGAGRWVKDVDDGPAPYECQSPASGDVVALVPSAPNSLAATLTRYSRAGALLYRHALTAEEPPRAVMTQWTGLGLRGEEAVVLGTYWPASGGTAVFLARVAPDGTVAARGFPGKLSPISVIALPQRVAFTGRLQGGLDLGFAALSSPSSAADIVAILPD